MPDDHRSGTARPKTADAQATELVLVAGQGGGRGAIGEQQGGAISPKAADAQAMQPVLVAGQGGGRGVIGERQGGVIPPMRHTSSFTALAASRGINRRHSCPLMWRSRYEANENEGF
jgi:hypothetical protein